jgi:hypothetical protein
MEVTDYEGERAGREEAAPAAIAPKSDGIGG